MKLKQIREAKGVKQKAVANMLNITRQAYARHEEKPWKMSIGEAAQVCEFLGIATKDVDDFSVPKDVIESHV